MQTIIMLIKLYFFKRRWRKINRQNSTYPKTLFPLSVCKVGRFTYGGINIIAMDEGNIVQIGNFCSIGPNVIFVLKADHPTNRLSTFPFKVKVLGEKSEATSKGNIILEDDVWVGCNATILSGVHIGQGAVVAAGAVVCEDVPPYAIVGGVPARVIRYRFPDDMVAEMKKIDFKKMSEADVSRLLEVLYTDVNESNFESILGQIKG